MPDDPFDGNEFNRLSFNLESAIRRFRMMEHTTTDYLSALDALYRTYFEFSYLMEARYRSIEMEKEGMK